MKINTTKRLLCALVAVLIAMTVLPGLSVIADDDPTGSILLLPPQKADKTGNVDITGMTVTAYQVLTASVDTDGKLVGFREHASFSKFFDGPREDLAAARAKAKADTSVELPEYFYLTFDTATKTLKYNVVGEDGFTVDPDKENVTYIKVRTKVVESDFSSDAGNENLTFGASLLSVILSGNKDSSAGMAGTQTPANNATAAKLIAEWLEAYAEEYTKSSHKTDEGYVEFVTKTGNVEDNKIEIKNIPEGYWLVVTENAPANVANVRTVLRTTKGKTETVTMKLVEQSVTKEVTRHGVDFDDTPANNDSASGGANELFDYKITADIQDMTDYVKDDQNKSKGYIYRIIDIMENQQLVSVNADGKYTVVSGTSGALNSKAFKVEFVGKKKNATEKNTVTYIDGTSTDNNIKDLNTILKANGKSKYGTYAKDAERSEDSNGYDVYTQEFVLDFDVDALHDLWVEQGWTDGVQIIITYTAELTSDALHENGNEVTKKYHNNPNINDISEDTTTDDEDDTDVWSFGFEMEKDFTGEDGNPANVKFKLYGPYAGNSSDPAPGANDTLADAKLIEFVNADGTPSKEPAAEPANPEEDQQAAAVNEEDEDGDDDGAAGVASNKYLDTGVYHKADSADAAAKKASIIAVNSNSTLRVTGLAPGYYVLEEIESDSAHGYIPAGKVLLYIGENGETHALLYDGHKNGKDGHDTSKTGFAELMKKFGDADPCIDNGTIKGNSKIEVKDGDETKEVKLDWLLTLKVLNYKENEYPETGGMGVLLLGVGGVLLIAAAAYIFLSQKKRNEA